MFTYKITIRTSDALWSGTDDYVYINLIGDHAQTNFRYLNTWMNDFEAGNIDKFELKAVSLGNLQAVELRKCGIDRWNVDWVEIIGENGLSFFQFEKPIGSENVRAYKLNSGVECDDILVSTYNGDSDLEDGHVGIWKKVGRLIASGF